jgi:thiamine biosynthesis lipoprotein
MGMPFTVELEGVSEQRAEAAVAAFHRELEHANATFSLWDDATALSRHVRGELPLHECPPEIGEVLDECERFRAATEGGFNAKRPDGTIDPTGIVKGWAVAKAARHVEAARASDWLIGASGDVLVAPGGRPRRLGIADPRVTGDPQGKPVVDVVELRGDVRAVASSGGTQDPDHIWDPATGLPARHYLQVSVAGKDLVECDAWATAIAAGGAATVANALAHGLHVLLITNERPDGTLAAQSSVDWPTVA